MSVYLIAAFVLLLVMVFLILRPFVAPVADGVAVDAAPAERAKAAAESDSEDERRKKRRGGGGGGGGKKVRR